MRFDALEQFEGLWWYVRNKWKDYNCTPTVLTSQLKENLVTFQLGAAETHQTTENNLFRAGAVIVY